MEGVDRPPNEMLGLAASSGGHRRFSRPPPLLVYLYFQGWESLSSINVVGNLDPSEQALQFLALGEIALPCFPHRIPEGSADILRAHGASGSHFPPNHKPQTNNSK